jgi:hypothetical protein
MGHISSFSKQEQRAATVIAGVLAAVMAVSLTACGGSPSQAACASPSACTPSPAGGDDASPDSATSLPGPVIEAGPAPDSAPVGAEAASPEAAPDAGCNAALLPSQEPCVVDSAYGIFVAPPASGGSDATGDGTKDKPFATPTRGVAAAAASAIIKRVYVCDATYDDHVTLDAAHDGISLFGGLLCPGVETGPGWIYEGGPGGTRAVIKPSTGGHALDVNGTLPLLIADLELDAQDAEPSLGGTSSVAVRVNGTGISTVTLDNDKLVAGAGAPGTDAAAPATNQYAGTLSGAAASGGVFGASQTCTCPLSGTSMGGQGGQESFLPSYSNGVAGTASPAAAAMGSADGAGGLGSRLLPAGLISACRNGDRGANGAGGGGGGGAQGGTLQSSAWTGTSGGAGLAGSPGQGGGGGGGNRSNLANTPPAAAGGGGACGGCGGNGGIGGGGGGASIALAVVSSSVSVRACIFVTGGGGRGGNASTGGGAQAGGVGGSSPACSGGPGGEGGGGGGGGGGAGGPSVALMWTGSQSLTLDGMAASTSTTSLPGPSGATLGVPGTGGLGGAAGAGGSWGAAGSNGANGALQAVLSL